MNIILIVVDSLRADHVGINGYTRSTTPNIDKIAKEGVIFPNCIATIPRTTPSVASILTGLYPHSHGIRELYTYKLDRDAATLQEILQSHGYKTAGHAIEIRNSGIEKGFDEFNPLSWRIKNKIKRTLIKSAKWGYKENPAQMMSKFAIKKINQFKGGRFFLYLHYVGPHWPYDVPSPYDEMFDKNYNGQHDFRNLGNGVKRGDLVFNNNLPKREVEHAIAHYDGALRYVDFQIGKVIEHLQKLNLQDETLVIMTADHGESLGEHGVYFSHGDYVYDAEIKVPLIFSQKILPKHKYEQQVQTTDIMPTLLGLLKIPLIDKVDGISLLQPSGNNEKRKFTYAEGGRKYFEQNKRSYIEGIKGKWRMIRSDEWKLICIPHPQQDIFELYDIRNDPFETKNVVEQEKNVFNEMRENLFKWMKDSASETEQDLTEKSKKLLRKLGYME